MPHYIPQLRPPHFSTLPEGVDWTYVEAPTLSRHPYGVVSLSRELTAEECDRFALRRTEPLSPADLRARGVRATDAEIEGRGDDPAEFDDSKGN